MKKTKTIKKPNWFLYFLIGPFIILWYKLHIRYRKNKVKIKKKSLIIAPHRSYFDFLTVPISVYPRRVHCVATTFWFRNKKLAWLLNVMGCIPKNQFKADLRSVISMGEVLKKNESILMFPEGQMSADGRSVILVPGIEKLILKFKPNVYFVDTCGAYLTAPKWNKGFKRGRVDANIIELFSEDNFDNVTLDEIKVKIDECFKNSYDFNYVKGHDNYVYKKKNKAEGLENVIRFCPKCNSFETIQTKDHQIYCESCDFSLTLNKKNYNFIEKDYFNNLGEYLDFNENKFNELIDNDLVLEDDAFVSEYEDVKLVDEYQTHVIMNKNEISITKDDKTLLFDLNKIINFSITLGDSFEIPTSTNIYHIKLSDGKRAINYWNYINRIKEKNENK